MKLLNILLLSILATFSLSSCNSDAKKENPITEKYKDAFIISSIRDNFAVTESEKTYKLYADHDDRYTFTSRYSVKLTILNEKDEVLVEANDEIEIDLLKDQIIYLKVENLDNENSRISVTAKYVGNPIKLPYPTNFKEQEIDTSYNNDLILLKAAEVNYVKRAGGTYIYSNNPEQFRDEDVNKCLMENKNLTGEVYMTYEHANYSNYDAVFLGYKLINDSEKDVYVTIENVGLTPSGSWFGQRAWYDFYNTKFELPSNYFTSGQYAFLDYAYEDYNPRIYTPTTYRLPAGESFFVLGGTTATSYNEINVGDTANKPVGKIKCTNANVKFKVTNGSVTGKMFIYDNPNNISDDMEEVGYITLRDGRDYGQQYSGSANHHGIIDNDMMWEFNDRTLPQLLPVKYTNRYAYDTSTRMPYTEYDNQDFERTTTSWMTHLNPQNDTRAVGMDMVEFTCRTTSGEEVVIDNYHADGSGEPANTANWMIEYQDNFTFVNRGNNARKVIIKMRDHGTLATLIRDKEGNVLQTYYSIGLADSNPVEYSFDVAPLSSLQVVVDYALVACSYGSVLHEVQLI